MCKVYSIGLAGGIYRLVVDLYMVFTGKESISYRAKFAFHYGLEPSFDHGTV